MILSLVASKDSVIVIASFQTLTKIIKSESMRDCWTNFLELIVIKFIETYNMSKEVNYCSLLINNFDSHNSVKANTTECINYLLGSTGD